MARDAMGKIREARELDKMADGLRKRDPSSATQFDNLAHGKRRSAIKQMKGAPKRRKKDRVTLSG